METHITPEHLATAAGKTAEGILRNCVHCGFCTATCPTYQLLGDELDGPRGRIYLIKGLLEGEPPTVEVQTHLDRCLTCRSCETTCPSGVQYSQLVHVGREMIATAGLRSPWQRLMRWGMRNTLAYPRRLKPFISIARAIRPALPVSLQKKIPAKSASIISPTIVHDRQVVLFDGCVQSVMAENINAAARNVLNQLGISVENTGEQTCCGAVGHHLDDKDTARAMARSNIDRWLNRLDQGAEAILFTASACLLETMEYPLLLAEDQTYLPRAERLAANCQDLAVFLEKENLEPIQQSGDLPTVAFHAPCTLQHGLQQPDTISSLLTKLGFSIQLPVDAHLCCGSAGTYSILQSELANQLRDNKLQALNVDQPDCIATANIGCLLHLAAKSEVPVKHWIELL